MTPTRAAAARLVLLTALAVAAPAIAQDTPPRGLESFGRPVAVPTPAAPVGLPVPLPTPRVRRTAPRPTPSATPSPRTGAKPAFRADEMPNRRPSATPRVEPTPVATPVATPAPTPEAMPTVTPAPFETPAAATPAPTPVAPEAASTQGGPSWILPIVGAVLVLAIAALLSWRRRKRSARVCATDDATPIEPGPLTPAVQALEAASSRATSVRPEPMPTPYPAPTSEPGPRPWIGLSLVPLRAGVNMATATADVDVTLTNVGDAPANAIRVGVSLLSARSGQDDELGRLFAQPIARPAAAPFALAPGETRTLRLLVTLPRSVLNVLDAGGRPMFVPVVAANIVYDRGDGGTGQTAAAFVIGIDRPGATKLGPFWLDTPGRMHDTLGIRPHALSLRS